MRWLIRDDRGVAMALVAVSMLALLGMAALVIDVGGLYEERRQLQNGADAAALAIANECADNSGTWPADAEGIAATYTDLNSRDGAGDVISVAFSSDGDFVQVRVRTERSDGVNAVAPLFSAVFGDTGTTVSAVATAICGESGFRPLILSTCEVVAAVGDPAVVPTAGPFTFEWQSGQPGDCQSPSGQLFPGGFGWLEADDCRIEVPQAFGTDGWWLLTEKGAPPSKAECEPDDFRDVVYLLEFDNAKGKFDMPYPDGCTPAGQDRCVHVSRIVKIKVDKVRFQPGGMGDRACDPPVHPSSNCLSGIIEAVMSIAEAEIDSTKPSRLVPESAFTG